MVFALFSPIYVLGDKNSPVHKYAHTVANTANTSFFWNNLLHPKKKSMQFLSQTYHLIISMCRGIPTHSTFPQLQMSLGNDMWTSVHSLSLYINFI
jgi:hypothetical protein